MNSISQPTCLICCSEEPPIRSSQFGDDELSKNLEIIFLLRTMFEVPPERLQYYVSNFTESGAASFNNWGIHLCWKCTTAVDNAKRTYDEMVKAIRLFQESKQTIIEQVKRSQYYMSMEYFNQPPVSKTDHLTKLMVKETRKLVCQNNYGDVTTQNPFKSGDLLAEQLAHSRLRQLEIHRQRQQNSRRKRSRTQAINPNLTSKDVMFQTLHLSTCPDHTGQKPHYRCPVCPKDLSHLAKLKFHVTRYHIEHIFKAVKLPEISEEKFKDCCTRLLDNLTDLNTPGRHLKESKSPICCTECQKGFTDKRYLHCHWIQHHFTQLCGMLHDVQRDDQEGNVPKIVKTSTVAQKVDKPMSNFKCNQCSVDTYFPNVHELQSHAVNLHPEQFFPEVEFNSYGISSCDYKASCKQLFKCVNIRKSGNESFGCPFCQNCYVGHLTIKLHLVTSHWDLMAKRLREILEGKLEEDEASSEDEVRVEISDQVKVEAEDLDVIILEDDVEETYEKLENYYEAEEDPLAL